MAANPQSPPCEAKTPRHSWPSLGLLAALVSGGAGCAVEGGRLYPVIGLGYVVVPTNAIIAGSR